MKKITNPGWLAAVALAAAGCAEEYPRSTVAPVTDDLGATVHALYETVFVWAIVILAVVWSLLVYVVVRYRARPGAPEPKPVRGHLGLEIAWTAIPAIIVTLIAVPTIRGIFRTQPPTPPGALVVEVVGHQWWWEFRYPEAGIVTANELHLPVGRPVELRMWSADVIHSFWVPRLGGKRDVNPAVRKPGGAPPDVNRLVFTISRPGVYDGQCAEFCGLAHAWMGVRVVAHPPAEFDTWLRAMATPVEPDSGTLEARGREVFLRSACVACHAIAGTPAQGALGPNLTRLGARTTLAAGRLENTPENLVRWITNPQEIKPGARMPGVAVPGGGFPPTNLTPEEVRAVAAYLSSLR